MSFNAVQLYRITKCCNSSETGVFTFEVDDVFGLINTGDQTVVVYNGVAQTLIDVNNNVVIFEPDHCYTVARFTLTNAVSGDLDSTDFAITASESCDDAVCDPCSTAPQMLVFTPCCEDFDTLYFQGVNYQDYLGVVIPITTNKAPLTPSYQQQSGGPTYNSLQFGYCYEVTVKDTTQANFDSLEQLPPYSEGNNFTQVTNSTSGLDCASPEVIAACPGCPQVCFIAINCEDATQISVLSDPISHGSADISNYVGQFVTLLDQGVAIAGTWYIAPSNTDSCNNSISTITVDPVLPPECDCRCFELVGNFGSVIIVDCNGNLTKTSLTKFCSKIYPIVNVGPGQSVTVNEGSNCIDGECPIECFILSNCETGEILTTESNLYSYFLANQIVTLNGYEGCWQVLSGECSCIIVTLDGIDYTANATSVNDDRLVYSFEYSGSTYYVWFSAAFGQWQITLGVNDSSGLIGEVKLGDQCPPATFIPRGGLFSVTTTLCAEQCESCSTNVTVLETFDDCPTCVGPTSYKLTNCDNNFDIIYTTNDLSAYVDKVVELENCGCYLVKQLSIVPPTDQDVTVLFDFTTCEECTSTYYKLTECDTGELIYTTDDLSAYLDSVIKIESCPDKCWRVADTRKPEVLSTVVVSQTYSICEECTTDLPCVCSKITNVSDTPTFIQYIDCDDVTVGIFLQPGETSDKRCLKKWLIADVPAGTPPTWYPEYFGECQEGVCPPENLVTSQNRKIKPGYNTPICSADKYDKITCEFADIYYKKALEGRYGISNCCPEELQDWTLKKTLIEMQALKDPHYKCQSQTKCSCGNTSTCTSCNCKN